MKRILKRSFVFIISFVLVFSISVPCFASDTSSEPAGWSSWTPGEKILYVEKYGFDIICGVTGIVHGDISGFKECVLDAYALRPEAGVTNFYEYLANGLSFDDDTETWELSDDLVDFCNTVIVDYNERVTMTYRYPLNKANIDASKFPNKVVFDAFVALLDAFPDYYFFFTSSDCQNPNFMINGKRNNFGYSYRVQVVKPFCGVNAYPDLVTTPVSIYNENWEHANYSQFWIISTDNFKTSDNISYFDLTSYDGLNNYIYGNYFSSLDDLKSTDFSFSYGGCSSLSMCNKFSWSRTFTDLKTPYSASDVPINVYKTVADMKKDIGSQVIGSYADTYTGTPSQTITQSEVNNFVNNYYPDSGSGGGSGSGSGSDSGGGSSGGLFDSIVGGVGSLFKGLASIIGAIVNGFTSIIEVIVSPIERIINTIVDLFKQFIDTIVSFTDLYDANIPLFFQSLFSFLPSGLVTVMTSSFVLIIIVAVIKFLRG